MLDKGMKSILKFGQNANGFTLLSGETDQYFPRKLEGHGCNTRPDQKRRRVHDARP
jgi:hypothetical protein